MCIMRSGGWRRAAADLCGCSGAIPVWMSRDVSLPAGARAAVRSCLMAAGKCVNGVQERSAMMVKENMSPCLGCNRVENCSDKSCRVWRRWFLDQWEKTREGFRQMKDGPNPAVGVPVGGKCYAAPNQVRAYLREDPCEACLCPPDLCMTPCRKRRVWEDCAREEN